MMYHFLKEKRAEIVFLCKEKGWSQNKIAQKFGCSRSPIGRILIKQLGEKEYKRIAKEHLQENRQKNARKSGAKTLAKWRKKHPEEALKIQQKTGRKAGQLPKTEKQLENARKMGQLLATEKQREASSKNIRKAQEASVKANPSKPEILFSLILANENIQFIHQFRIFYKDINNKKRVWFVDFFIFPNIVVQIDGVYYHCRKKKGNLLKDWLQNRELKKLGYKVTRFWDFEINNITECINKSLYTSKSNIIKEEKCTKY